MSVRPIYQLPVMLKNSLVSVISIFEYLKKTSNGIQLGYNLILRINIKRYKNTSTLKTITFNFNQTHSKKELYSL